MFKILELTVLLRSHVIKKKPVNKPIETKQTAIDTIQAINLFNNKFRRQQETRNFKTISTIVALVSAESEKSTELNIQNGTYLVQSSRSPECEHSVNL